MNTIRGSCIEKGQNDGHTLTVNKKYVSLDNLFIHRCVIKWVITNKWGVWGCTRKSSLNNLTMVSIADGGGVQILGVSCVCN